MKKIKILKHIVFVRNFPRGGIWGGMEVLLFDLLKRMDFSSCQVTLLVSSGSKVIFEEYLRKEDWPVMIIEIPLLMQVPFWRRFIVMLKIFASLKPDVIVFFQGWLTDYYLSDVIPGCLISKGNVYFHDNFEPPLHWKKKSKKHFGFIPGIGAWWYIQLISINMRTYFCKAVLVVSRGIADKWISIWRYPTNKIIITYHGVNTERFCPSEEIRKNLRKAFDVPLESHIILAAGRFKEEKRFDRIIDAFDFVAQKHLNIYLFLAGSGPLEKILRDLANSKKSNERIRFLGHIQNIDEILKMSDIFSLPSDREGLSLALMEALASGLICVSTDCNGSNEAIENGINGFVIDKSVQGVAHGLEKSLGLSVDQRIIMQQRARQVVIHKFEINKNVQQLFQIIGIPFNSAFNPKTIDAELLQ